MEEGEEGGDLQVFGVREGRENAREIEIENLRLRTFFVGLDFKRGEREEPLD